MKSLVRSILINAVSLWAVIQSVGAISFAKGYETLLITAAVLGLVNLFIRPIINILLLPLNLLTLGTMHWLVNVATLYLVTVLVSDFTITTFAFPGFSYQGFTLPVFAVGGFLALILTSFLLSLLSNFLFWLVR